MNIALIDLPTSPYQKHLACMHIRGLLEDLTLVPLKKRVLCFDDDLIELSLRSVILQANGYEVSSASSGRSGLKMMVEAKFDVVLLDYCMPDMDGFRVASEARRLDVRSPILIVSGSDIDELPEQVFELTDGFIQKGTPPLLLIERVRELTGHVRALN